MGDVAAELSRETIAIVGGGAMGIVCAVLLASGGHQVRLWCHRPETVRMLLLERQNRRLLPDVTLPEGVGVTSDAADALAETSLIVNAVPTQFTREAFGRLASFVPPDAAVVSCAKGLELDTLLRPTEVLRQTLGDARAVAAMSGPNIATELGRGKPATAVAASSDRSLAERVQRAFGTPYFRLYTSEDVLGVELAGATKNVIALAAGMLDGLGGGYNAKAGLVTRGLVEIARLGTALGARPATFAGLAGLGDLVTTCFSPCGRNRTVGERLARGERLSDVLAETASVAEGVPTTRAVYGLSRQIGVEMPILTSVHEILFEAKHPADALSDLMSRDPKPERTVASS